MYNYTFTVFTATYNRAHTIHRVYDSLKTQTFKDFEWLIIDDGSTDDTEKIIKKWMSEANFEIRYFKKNNGGKHTAFNLGVQKANGELFLPLDSDDSCIPEALEIFDKTWNEIEDKSSFSAVTGLCRDASGELVGQKYPKDIFDSDSIELKYIHKVNGEKWGFQKTDVLKEFPFPEPKDLKLYPEAVIWNKISRKYKTRFINQTLRIYIQGEDSYTKAPIKKFAKASAIWHTSVLNDTIDYFWNNPLAFFKTAVHYTRFTFHSKTVFFSNLKNNLARFVVIMSLPVAMLVYIRDSIKG
ncbi:glycosyltransferase family 2 protein [Hyunsoonleella sp. 2307UL5-6]|uniref:glycosyltransferase family 2 protein n=1 Tax=Hyunsoonleella sp. 2307UL5-6 TaxID=3384768 RepID=UPI0039BC8E97